MRTKLTKSGARTHDAEGNPGSPDPSGWVNREVSSGESPPSGAGAGVEVLDNTNVLLMVTNLNDITDWSGTFWVYGGASSPGSPGWSAARAGNFPGMLTTLAEVFRIFKFERWHFTIDSITASGGSPSIQISHKMTQEG